MIRRFRSTSEMVRCFKETGAKSYDLGSQWTGGESEAETLRKAVVGDRSLVGEAETLLHQLQTKIETPHRIWDRAAAGPICIVPDILVGLPTPFRRQREVHEDSRPIEIFFDVGSSGGISASILQKRGTVALALVMALCRIRPVSLHIIDCSNGNFDRTDETVLTARIETAPLDLAAACYALTSVGLVRGLMYGLETKLNGFTGGWPKGFSLANPKPYYDKLMPRLTANLSQTLLIEAARINDPMLAEPVEWINAQIRRFTASQAEAA